MSEKLEESQVVGTPLSCAGHFAHEGGWDTGVGRVQPSKQMKVSL